MGRVEAPGGQCCLSHLYHLTTAAARSLTFCLCLASETFICRICNLGALVNIVELALCAVLSSALLDVQLDVLCSLDVTGWRSGAR